MTEKRRKIHKENNNGLVWIRITVRQPVWKQESILDSSATTCWILHYRNLPIYRLPVLVRLKLHDPCKTLAPDTD